MRSTTFPIAAAAALLLHAALIAVLVIGFRGQQAVDNAPVVLRIEVLPAQAPEPQVEQAVPPPEQKPAKVKPRARPKAAQQPREKDVKQERVPTPSPADAAPAAAPPAPSAASASPEKAAADASGTPDVSAPPRPAAAAPVTRTRASVATYAASNRKPPYPRLSRLNDEQGTVVLRVLVNTDGTAGAVEILASSGYPLLDRSAQATVLTWRFNPATVNGVPVAEWYRIPIPFTLHDN